MVRVTLLGTGSPNPLPERQGPAVLLSHGAAHVLVDAGRGVTTQLVGAGVAPQDLSAVLITHHHYDHIGNLGDLLLTAWHGGSARLPVFGPPGTDAIVDALWTHVYHRELRFSHVLANATAAPLPAIRTVVAVQTITAGKSVQHGDWHVRAAAVEHGHGLGLTHDEWPCLAYRIEVGGKAIVISGDTIACANLVALARDADLLVQCCFLADADCTTPARRLLAEQVIATSGQVGTIAAQAGVRHLVLTHLRAMEPAMLAALVADVRRDFTGPVTLGADLLTIDV